MATVANANTYSAQLDHAWWSPCRLNDATLDAGSGLTCPAAWTCIADQVGGNYVPWLGLAFDLGAPANQVAVFGDNTAQGQPCQSLEVTVFMTDNPNAHQATDVVLDPRTQGADPTKWNRVSLTKVFTWGWSTTRAPDPANFGVACGDTATFAVEADSFVQVFSLPCGTTMRYAAIVAGNDGLDFPSCANNASTAHIDAIAGLTEAGAGVCPDQDQDGFVDCACPGAPAICDCNDADPRVHPGAPEACDAVTDLNCDGVAGSACASGSTCYQSQCDSQCRLPTDACPLGSGCASTVAGALCVPATCGCTAGSVCVNGTCVDPCVGVTCPGAQTCVAGACVDPCASVVCPSGTHCEGGVCSGPCTCFAGDAGCAGTGLTCAASTGQCTPSLCANVQCASPQTCDPQTGSCRAFCNPGVVCPSGEKCVSPTGCVPLCTGVVCPAGATCVAGGCVGPDAGVVDAGSVDAGSVDAGRFDGGTMTDGGSADAGNPEVDAGASDAGGALDAGAIDAGGQGSPDAGGPVNSAVGCGCASSSGAGFADALLGVWALAMLGRRRQTQRLKR
jgi:uncharacterized protein (TIGR03382 family)